MGNFPRYIPEGLLVEVTTRTIQGRLLLVPSRDLNDIVCGVLARALSRYRVEIVDFKVMSNHVHLLLWPTSCATSMGTWQRRLDASIAGERSSGAAGIERSS